jgi:Histidine kinase-, DNA gyrase B-, and HSP90-like ATPase
MDRSCQAVPSGLRSPVGHGALAGDLAEQHGGRGRRGLPTRQRPKGTPRSRTGHTPAAGRGRGRPGSQRSGHRQRCRIELYTPLVLRWKLRGGQQVLANLLDNALRHTPTGGAVTVHATATPRTVTITVTDNGDGIPTEHRQSDRRRPRRNPHRAQRRARHRIDIHPHPARPTATTLHGSPRDEAHQTTPPVPGRPADPPQERRPNATDPGSQ